MRLSVFSLLFSLLLALIAWSLFSCGPPPGGEIGQQPGIAASGVPPAQQQLSEFQKKLDEINQRISAGEDEDRELQAKVDDLRSQRDAAQAVLGAIQTNTQSEINQRTDAYAAQDLQVQSQQLDLQIVRSQLEAQIQNQKSAVAQLDSLVSQEQAWGFESPELQTNSAALAQARQSLANLESQYWGVQQQAGAISALQTESRTWGENEDRTTVEQNSKQQYDSQAKQVQQLTAQYNDALEEQQKLRDSIGELEGDFRHTRDDYQALQASLNAG